MCVPASREQARAASSTCACLLLLVHRAGTLIFIVPAVGTKVGGLVHALWCSKSSRKKLLFLPPRRLPRHAPQPLSRGCFPCLEWSRSPLAHRQDRDANIAKTRKYFDVTVKNETGPTLFHTWEGYEAHLPRREASSGPPLDLSRRGRLAIGPRIHGPTCSTSRAPKVAKGLVAQRA